MHLTISPADMQRIERTAFAQGVPSILLMEQAAQSVVCVLEDILGSCESQHVLFVAGCGNNGGGNWGWGNGLGSSAFGFVGEWVNIVVTLTILQSILGLVCNWNCGGNCGCGCGN